MESITVMQILFKCRTLEGLGRQEEAVASYQYVVEQHKSSAYAGLSQKRLDVL